MKRSIVLLNIIALLGLGGLIYYLIQKIDYLKQTSLMLQELAEQSMRLNQVEKLLAETGAARRQIDDYFLESQSLPALIGRLESLAVANDLLFSFTDAVALKDRPETFELTFKAEGRFSDLLRFLTLVETLPVHSRLRRAELNYEELAKQWSANFVLNVFARHEI